MTWTETIGLEVESLDPDAARASLAVHDGVRQPVRLLHGGVVASLADSLTESATAAAVAGDGRLAAGLSTHTSFLRPVTAGTAHAAARARHRGRSTWVWEVEITDDDGRLCALVRATVAIREDPDR